MNDPFFGGAMDNAPAQPPAGDRQTRGGMKLRDRSKTGRRKRTRASSRPSMEERYGGGDDDDVMQVNSISASMPYSPEDVVEENSIEASMLYSPDDAVVVSDDDDDDDSAGPVNRPRVEKVSFQHVKRAVQLNQEHADFLMRMRDHVRRNPHGMGDPDRTMRDLATQLVETMHTLEDLMPMRSALGPMTHALPPEMPLSDGSEKRFTDVARELGIHWARVPQEDKLRVYERAAELHRQLYGTRPRRVRMWTSQGFRPVYYYTEQTYGSTMVKALLEYRRGGGIK